MSHLWFVENRAQAKWVRDCPQEVANCTVVAQTAEALQALEEFGIRHCAVAEYADTRLIAEVGNQLQSDCFDLMTEIEDYIISHYDDAEISDTGYLTAHIYWVYHAVITLATRAHLWQETIRACRPSKVSIFKVVTDESYVFRTPHPWYPSLPMSSLLRQFESLYSFRFDVRSYDLRESRGTVGSQTQSS
ncbi:MAG: hypothetical protein QF704_16555, partial [Anaerolineales bacterium]|nr:hypothetical protein [Anaerolineales bacterium]